MYRAPVRAARPALRSLLASLLLAACATQVDPGELGLEPPDGELDEPVSPGTDPGGDAPTANEIILAALTDVESYWADEFPRVYGEPYERISGGFFPYGPGTELPPCDEPGLTYEKIAANAFYCSAGDLVAWDEVQLTPDLYEEFGGFTLAIVMAHEVGHAVQVRAGVRTPGIVFELQADCFAGAWSAAVEAGEAPSFTLTVDDLDRAVAGFLELRDGVGVAAQEPLAHGTGFDRIGAFQEGYEQGADRCADYPELADSGELVVVEVPFTDQDDFERGGDLPLDEVFPLAVEDLEDFWSTLFEEQGEAWEPVTDVAVVRNGEDTVDCGDTSFTDLEEASFYCIEEDTIYMEQGSVIDPLYDIGDYAVVTELARLYAFAAQVRMGETEESLAANLAADCYAGIYASSGFTGNRGEDQALFLSPGDLDEAVIGFLRASEDASADETEGDTVGSAFERFDAYRTGFMDGVQGCEQG